MPVAKIPLKKPVGVKKKFIKPSSSRTVVPSETTDTVPPFPVEAFPKRIREFIRTTAEALPCPPDIPGSMLLAVAGALIGRKSGIQLKKGWVEYPTLWIAAVARSGERKSPAFATVTAPLRTIQTRLQREYQHSKRKYDSLSPAEQKEESRPKLRQVSTTDVTIEALKDILVTNPNGIIIPVDELSGLVRSHGQYKGGRGDDRQHWLSMWSGIQIICNRKGADPIIIDNPHVCITGGLQPDVLPEFISNECEDGFSARMLFAYPDPIPSRSWNDDVVKKSDEYHSVCEKLYKARAASVLTFTVLAKAEWVKWVNKHRIESTSDNLRATWSKAEGHCARIALVLYHLRKACGETKLPNVDLGSVKGAIQLIEYFKGHAKRVYKTCAIKSDTGRIGNALKWIRKHGGDVTAKLAHQYGLTKTSDEAKELFRILDEQGHGRVTNEARGSVRFRLDDGTTKRRKEST